MTCQILGVTADNAANNGTMLDVLSTLLPKFRGREVHVRCFAHVLNLVVKV